MVAGRVGESIPTAGPLPPTRCAVILRDTGNRRRFAPFALSPVRAAPQEALVPRQAGAGSRLTT